MYFKQKQDAALSSKIAPPYAILFMASLEEQFLKAFFSKHLVRWSYIDDISSHLETV